MAPPSPSRSCTVDLTCDLTAPRAARHLLAAVLPQWGVADPDVLDAASIVVSELVTNVLVHCGESGSLTLSLELSEEVMTLWVADRAPGVPAQRTPTDDDEDGRGLGIVAQLVSSWDVEPLPQGKRVVVELPLQAAWCT